MECPPLFEQICTWKLSDVQVSLLKHEVITGKQTVSMSSLRALADFVNQSTDCHSGPIRPEIPLRA